MIKQISKEKLKEADDFQESILNPEKKKRYRPFSYVKKQHEKNPFLFLCYCARGKIEGVLFAYEKKKSFLVGEIAVSEKSRGKGIGKKFIKKIEIKAKKMNKEKIVLGAMESAEKFYKKLGYSPVLFVQTEKKYDLSREEEYKIIKKQKQGKWTKFYINAKRSAKVKKKAEKDFKGHAIFVFEKTLY